METSENGGTLPRARSARGGDMHELTSQEQTSVTHSGFWIPEAERETYKRALRTLNAAGVPYVISGAYAIYVHTKTYRETKDLDVFAEPAYVIDAMRALKRAGFRARLEQPHWVAKAIDGDHYVDVIFGMGNGLAPIDRDWYRHSEPSILAATPVRVAPPEESIWHRLFISERHRHDMADIAHLILAVGAALDWRRLLDKTGPHWPLLLAQIQTFAYVYPEAHGNVPDWVTSELLDRARADLARPRTGERITRGTMVSRFSFAIDVNEWGFRDLREECIRRLEAQPAIRAIAASDVWDERSAMTQAYDARFA